jgi:hypothetical protein
MTKLNINLAAGIVEVEGEEQFVRDVYADYKSGLFKQAKVDSAIPAPKPPESSRPSRESGGERIPKKGPRRQSGFELVRDLDLTTLRELYKTKKPTSGFEKNVVFVYYLQQTLGMKSGITPNHIYTCYKSVGEKFPAALKQSLIDTARRKGWIDTRDTNSIKLSTIGENLVEHDLPRAEPEKR